ncbi:type VI secretion system tip protein VgrG [Pseudomonas sp. S31]|uniref:type VI secretion system Vgr family protein n=1 Tax=Pseudomonas sp. S31 TaxID=1564473 RepID=UPI001914C93C|nr:type VI secretion system tip protein TssI/VgrG [Pseudomonas sp. S31]MBK4998187.1 type VI secretion system tip protein VgrG [Pseudomonas sp. S31]
MPNQSDLRFTFQPLVGDSLFEVVSFSLTEAVSTPFRLTLELVSFQTDVNFTHLLDQPVLFTLWRADRPVRYVHGLVSTFSQGETGFRRTHYHAVVEPQLARASLRSNWRIFQQKTVPQILDVMLKGQGILRHDLFSSLDHQVREFCVQAGETDLEFITRLAAEEGFVYRFEHSAKQHKLIFTDRLLAFGQLRQGAITQEGDERTDDSQRPKIDTVLYHTNSGGDQPGPCLHRLRYSEQVRTSRQVQRDYTFTNPAYRQEHAANAHGAPWYERFDYPGRYKRDAVGKPFTANKLTALRHDARIAKVKGDDMRLQPGLSFTLTEHPREDLNAHWRVVEVTHTGSQFTSLQEEAAGADRSTHYEQTAVLVPGMAEWRPKSPDKPRIDGPHMATVVGPPGEEIYCDEWGRVKVSFPWDRESQDNQFSSCWVRVSQGWAGLGWGSMAIPRVGQDVVIQYVNADPDQPMITGRTYCGNQLPPYELPAHKTRMTIKSKTHKGKGFNELRFEDELGRQEVFIHAERDQNNVVKHDETTRVGRNRVEEVGNDEQLTVGHDLRQETGRDRIHRIGRSSQITVGHDLTEQVDNDRFESTGANQRISVGGDSDLFVKGHQSISIGEGVSQQTTVYELKVSERVEFRSPGGSIVLDQEGITINGRTLTLLGPTKAGANGEGNVIALELTSEPSTTCEEKRR